MNNKTCDTWDQVRHYSATDERNGRVNPALNLGSDSDDDLNDASETGAANRIRRLSKSGPSAQRLINRKLSLGKMTPTPSSTPPITSDAKGAVDKTSVL